MAPVFAGPSVDFGPADHWREDRVDKQLSRFQQRRQDSLVRERCSSPDRPEKTRPTSPPSSPPPENFLSRPLSPCSEGSSIDNEISFRPRSLPPASTSASVPASAPASVAGAAYTQPSPSAALEDGRKSNNKGSSKIVSSGRKRSKQLMKKFFSRTAKNKGSGAQGTGGGGGVVSGGGAGGSSAADSLCSSLGRESSSHQTEAVGVPKSVEVPGADGGVDLYAAALRSIRSGDSTEAETSPDLDRMRSTDLLSGESGSSDDVDFEFDRSVEELRRSRSPIEDVILGARSPEPPDSWQQQQQARGRQQQQQQTRGRQQQPEQPEQPLPVMASISAQNIIDQLAAVVSTPGNVSKRTPRDSPIRNRYTPAPKTPDHRPEEGWAADHEDGDNVGGGGGNATPEADRDVKTFFSSLLRTPGNPKTREGKPPHPISTIGARKQTTTDQQSDTVVKKSRTEKNASMAKSADIVNTGAVEAKKSEAVTRGGGKASVIETRREEGKKQQQVETESVVRRLHVTCTSLPESSLREETLADRSPLSETYSEGDGGAIGDKGDKPATAFSLPSVPEDLAAGEGGSAPPQALGMGKDINHAEAEGQSPATTPSPSSSGSGISDAEEVLRLNLGLRSSHAAESTSGAITKGGGALLEGLSSSYSPSEHAPKYSEGELQAKINAAVSSAKRGWADRLDETAQQAEEVERLREDAERLRGERKREEEMVIAERALREEEEKIRRVEEKKERAESEMVQMELDKKAEEEAKNQLSKEAEMLSSEEIQRLREEHKADLMILLRQKDQNLEAERKQWEELTAQKMSVQREEHQRILAEAVSAVEGGKDDLLAEGWDERQEELLGQVASLERQLADIQALHERELLSVQDQQRAEIDELINQLDAVEAEHNARYKKLRSEVGQKDAVISAVGTQLAEVNDKNMALQKASMAMTTDLEGARAEAEATRIAATELEESLELMRVDHKKAKDDEARRRAAACEEIKADMIRQAEEQFAVANAHYLKLKGEFENAKNANGKLEKELQKARDESRQVEKRRQAEEVEMRADVAQLRAALAAVEADAAKATRNYTSEIECNRESEQVLRAELEIKKTECSTAHQSLATIVTEKERLKKDNAELNSVCEELMAMVEAGQSTPAV